MYLDEGINRMGKTTSHPEDFYGDISQAVQWHISGELDKAEIHCRLILEHNPNHADALHLIGLISHQRKDYNAAVSLIGQAISINALKSDFYCDLGSALSALGNLDQAREAFRKALDLKPNCAKSAFNLGNLYLRQGFYSEAAFSYQLAISIKGNLYQAYTNLAAVFNKQGEFQKALACCRKGLQYAAEYPALHINMANALQGNGNHEQAAVVLQKAITLAPLSPEAWGNLGNILNDLSKSNQAIDCYLRALQIDPDNSELLNNLGIVYNKLGLCNQAAVCYKKAIALCPGQAKPYHNLGNIHLSQERYGTALQLFSKAVSLNSGMIEAHVGLGIALQQTGRRSEASSCFRRAVELAPDNPEPLCHLVRLLQHECQWDELNHYGAFLDKFTTDALNRKRKPEEMPFLHLTRHCNPAANFRIATAWSRCLESHIRHDRLKLHAHSRMGNPENRTITLGYISNNFKNHPTAHLIEGLFNLHDRAKFSVHCYSYGKNDGSAYRQKIESDCDRFMDIQNDSHVDAAKKIMYDRVDILIDLVGYMKNNRMAISALRPAPVQVRWLGMAGTCGADFYDYIITDKHVTPLDEACHYAETFAFMPDTYQINSHPVISRPKLSRKDSGLPEKSFVFASFCSTYKIDQLVYRAWMDILKQVPHSVLWMLSPSDEAKNRLRSEAYSCGINPDRIVFADSVARSDHLSRIRHADVCLDTMGVNGALTTSEALWAGVPVITIRGRHFASRMGCSILNALEMSELVTTSLDEYTSLAVRLGREFNFHRQICATLELKRSSAALFDNRTFVRNLESLFRKMWRSYQLGGKKVTLTI